MKKVETYFINIKRTDIFEIIYLQRKYKIYLTISNNIFCRIITNGSLPRDKRLGYTSSFDSPKSPSKNQPHFSFDIGKQTNWGTSSYENISVQNSKSTFQSDNSPASRKDQTAQVENHSCDSARSLQSNTLSNQSARYSDAHNTKGNYFSGSISRDGNYENVIIDNNNKKNGSYAG